MRTNLIDLINMQTSLICKLFSLDSVEPLWRQPGSDVICKQTWRLGLITLTLLLFSLDAKTNLADVRTVLNRT